MDKRYTLDWGSDARVGFGSDDATRRRKIKRRRQAVACLLFISLAVVVTANAASGRLTSTAPMKSHSRSRSDISVSSVYRGSRWSKVDAPLKSFGSGVGTLPRRQLRALHPSFFSQRSLHTRTQPSIDPISPLIHSSPLRLQASTKSEGSSYVPFGEGNEDLPMFVEALKPGREASSETVCMRKGKSGEALAIPQAHRYVSKDWLHILREMPRSTTLSRIKGIVSSHAIWAFSLALFHKFIFALPHFASPTLVTPALGLLLVFRTNAAYNRFWEGCQLWEKLTDQSRCLIRYATLYAPHAGPARAYRIGRLLTAFALVLKQHLTHERAEETEYVEKYLLEERDIQALATVGNRPLFLLNLIAAEVQAIPESLPTVADGGFSSRERLAMMRMIDVMTTVIGSCERIVQTPVPLNYARHTSRFLTFWCLTLPLALVHELGFAVVPVTALVVWAMFGIQEIGLMIEEPFRRSLSLHVFCNTIHHDIQETLSCYKNKLEKEEAEEYEPSLEIVNEYRTPPGVSSHIWRSIIDATESERALERERASLHAVRTTE
ncbi:hypothetical protein AAMO2058_001729900 [Amorphochlora amoebiformis]